MGKVRERKETGTLYLDFMYEGLRCREQTALPDTPANRKKTEALLNRIEAKILLEQFDYAEHFPGSRMIKRIRDRQEQLILSPKRTGSRCADDQRIDVPTFSVFATQWFDELKVGWRNSHVRNVEAIINGSLNKAFGDKRLDQVTKADLMAYRAAEAQRPGRGESGLMSPKTINTRMGILKMIFTESSDRYSFDNPYRNIKPLKLRRSHIEPFSLDDVNLIIDRVRPDFSHYYAVRFYTGMRTGEVDGLRWEYVDFERRQILIRETRVRGQVEYTKTDGSQREIPMLGPVYDALRAQYEATGKLSRYVFCNRTGEPLDHANVTKRVWYPLLRHLGLNKRRPYQTRHTAATLLLASGENPEWVARVLGHSSTEMLFKVYSRYVPNVTRQDGSAFERLVRPKPPVIPKSSDDKKSNTQDEDPSHDGH